MGLHSKIKSVLLGDFSKNENPDLTLSEKFEDPGGDITANSLLNEEAAKSKKGSIDYSSTSDSDSNKT
jgi:hypothetical protein